MKAKMVGKRNLTGRLNRIRKGIPKNVKKLHEEAVEVGYNTAKSNVPVDSGELRDSITKTKNELSVGADHGVTVEYGTYKTEAKPFYRPAVEDMREYLRENMRGVIDDA